MNPAATSATLQLRDIHMPADPVFWPPAPGWWLVAIVVFALLILGGIKGWRLIKIHQQRVRILKLLERLEQATTDSKTPEFLGQLSVLLRRLALMRYPREQIASLTGDDWLQFLDTSGGNGQFLRGPGRLLADGPYLRKKPDSMDTTALVSLVRSWIKRNTGN